MHPGMIVPIYGQAKARKRHSNEPVDKRLNESKFCSSSMRRADNQLLCRLKLQV